MSRNIVCYIHVIHVQILHKSSQNSLFFSSNILLQRYVSSLTALVMCSSWMKISWFKSSSRCQVINYGHVNLSLDPIGMEANANSIHINWILDLTDLN